MVPFHAARIRPHRHDPNDWPTLARSLADLGVTIVVADVPWSVHERAVGDYDFGERDRRLDVAGFVRVATDAGLLTIAALGPCTREENLVAIPERVVWRDAVQRRTARVFFRNDGVPYDGGRRHFF